MPTNNEANYIPTQYNILSGGASGAINNIAPSTSGFILTSNGASSQPTFQSSTASTGAFVLLNEQTANTSASIVFNDTYITSSYATYVVTLSCVRAVSPPQTLNMVMSTNNGSSYLSSGYIAGNSYIDYNSASFANANSTSLFPISQGIASSGGIVNGWIWMYNLNTSTPPSIVGDIVGQNTQLSNTFCYFQKCFGYNTTTSGVNAIQFSMASGNISVGFFTLYGVVQ
jgi:hypothetical protein